LFVLADAAGRMFTNGSDPEARGARRRIRRVGASQREELGRVPRYRSTEPLGWNATLIYGDALEEVNKPKQDRQK
jgi:hypothetical protein